jgi:hypothetical protein
LSFIDDSLLKAGSNIQNHGEDVQTDEQLTPTLENMIILTWLRLINTELPALIKQPYGTELRSKPWPASNPRFPRLLTPFLRKSTLQMKQRFFALPFNALPNNVPTPNQPTTRTQLKAAHCASKQNDHSSSITKASAHSCLMRIANICLGHDTLLVSRSTPLTTLTLTLNRTKITHSPITTEQIHRPQSTHQAVPTPESSL